MTKYMKGEVVSAKVTAIEKYGVFAKIDAEYSGLIHISEITDKFVRDVNDFFDIGDEIKVKILDISDEKNQLKLSAKDLNTELFKSKKGRLKETVFGFYLLKSALPGWIKSKMEEINKKS